MKHLKETGHNYFSHMLSAFGWILRCQLVSLKLFVLAFFPFICENTGLKDLGKK